MYGGGNVAVFRHLAAAGQFGSERREPALSVGRDAAGYHQPTATCTGTHTVITGDNLFRLAYACGLTIEQLAAANNIVYPYTIYPGQTLVYP